MYAALAILVVTTTLTSAIDWNGNNWALWCDFNGNDLTNAATKSENCGGKCASTPGCTHFTWTDYNGGTCWMKTNSVSKSNAFSKYDSNAVCGVLVDSGSPPPQSSQSGKSTRYWDCCKPSCSWNGKASVTNPVNTCFGDGVTVNGDRNAASGCSGDFILKLLLHGLLQFGEQMHLPVTTICHGPYDLAYGFAAANIKGKTESDWCCACYQLTFNSGPVNGKKMVVQVTNTGGDLGENHFDLQIPGGGVGIFNGCSSQWNSPTDGWGDRYGGVHSEQECEKLPQAIRNGCKWRFQWFQNADNPTFTFVQVTCPQELTSRSGCVRR